MYINNLFKYRPMERETLPSGVRYYVCPDTGNKLPSVTTVLDATGDKKALLEWKKRVGEVKAEKEKVEASKLGSLMHEHLECHVLEMERPAGNNYARVMARKMADLVIDNGLVNVDEVWGSEIALYYPQLFAGTTDLIGIHKGVPTIMDFKTTKKMKKREHIDNYFCQLTAYALAHNHLYGTNIETGVIFMASREFTYQEFVLKGDEFHAKKDQFLDRLGQFLDRS